MLDIMAWWRRHFYWVAPLLLAWLLIETGRYSSLVEAAGAEYFTANYLAIRDAFCISFLSPYLRALAIAAVLVVWQFAVRATRRRTPGNHLWQATLWGCALALTLATLVQATIRNRAIGRNVRDVLEAAKRDQGHTPIAGVFSAPWSGITASGRFAVFSSGCGAIFNLAWGYVVQDGPFLRRVYEETGTFDSGKYLRSERFLIAEDKRFGTPERAWATIEDLQRVLITEKHPLELPVRWIAPKYDSNTLAIARAHLAEFLRHEPVRTHITSVRRIPRGWSLTEPDFEGSLDHGRDVGLVPGMAFCASSENQEWGRLTIIIATVSERQSTFISKPSTQRLHSGLELTSTCDPR